MVGRSTRCLNRLLPVLLILLWLGPDPASAEILFQRRIDDGLTLCAGFFTVCAYSGIKISPDLVSRRPSLDLARWRRWWSLH
jgi:hypothetical protein